MKRIWSKDWTKLGSNRRVLNILNYVIRLLMNAIEYRMKNMYRPNDELSLLSEICYQKLITWLKNQETLCVHKSQQLRNKINVNFAV